MDSQASEKDYFIWGIDDSPYGPVPLPVLVDWISDERVLPDTWIFKRSGGVWQKAVEFGELKDYFQTETGQINLTSTSARLKPGSLRRIKILADLKFKHQVDNMGNPLWKIARLLACQPPRTARTGADIPLKDGS